MAHVPTKHERRRVTHSKRVEWHQCSCGKHGYQNQADAISAALRASWTKEKGHRIYRCTISNSRWWHVTTQVPVSQQSVIQKIDKTIAHGNPALDSIRKVHQASL